MAAASELKKGDYFKHNNEILRLIRKELVAYGTHSHSKLKLYVKALGKKGEKTINLHHTDKVEILDIKYANQHPYVFTHLTVHYIISGMDVNTKAVERAIELSSTRYCPAQAMLEKSVAIDQKYTLIETE